MKRIGLLLIALALPSAPVDAQTPMRIPLVEGLVEVAAVQRPSGDEEQVMTITRADGTIVEFTVVFRSMGAKGPVTTTRTREVRREDLAKSNRRNIVFQDGDPPKFPGSTLAHLSAATLAELKATGRSAVIVGTLSQADAEAASGFVAITAGRKYFRGTLIRVEPGVVPISVLVNGKPTRLDTVHAKGVFTVGGDSVDTEVWVLDDPLNPLVLRGRQGRNLGQTIRLDFPIGKPKVAQLQAALAGGACRANLSGIYFDFGKASLLPQSASTLQAVANTMTANPVWSLRIEGHTDNVGTAAFNLDLSQRRAAAVRDALIAQFKVPAARLAASGFGATKPVSTNASLDGRAANRRVEIARTCP